MLRALEADEAVSGVAADVEVQPRRAGLVFGARGRQVDDQVLGAALGGAGDRRQRHADPPVVTRHCAGDREGSIVVTRVGGRLVTAGARLADAGPDGEILDADAGLLTDVTDLGPGER